MIAFSQCGYENSDSVSMSYDYADDIYYKFTHEVCIFNIYAMYSNIPGTTNHFPGKIQ